MAIFPIRQLGKLGLNTDFDPRLLPAEALTTARNVRFEKGSITRGPRFFQQGSLRKNRPCFVQGHPVPNGSFEYLIAYLDGSICRWSASNDPNVSYEDDLTPIGQTPFDYPESVTSAILQDTIYLNRPDRALSAMPKAGERFKPVKDWHKDWRCKAVRSINGAVVAIGFSRDGRFYPTAIKSSDFAPYRDADSVEWVSTTSNSATENILGGLGERLVDGCALRQRMYLYAENETWAMTPNLGNSVYDYQQVFPDRGVIAPNCVVNVSNTHYVFGPHGIFTHDGTTATTLTEGANNDAIFKHLVRRQKYQFFAVHIPQRQEVMFAFLSEDPDCKFPVGKGKVPAGYDDYPGCNRAFVYNYLHNTAVIDDLPYLVGGAVVSPYGGKRWEEMTGSWADATGSWDDYADHTPPMPIFVSVGAPAPVTLPTIKATPDTFNLTFSPPPIVPPGLG